MTGYDHKIVDDLARFDFDPVWILCTFWGQGRL